MKRVAVFGVSISLLLGMVALVWGDEPGATLPTQLQKENYSIGYQLGVGMRYDEVVLDTDALVQGLEDAIRGGDPALSRDEMKTLIIEIKRVARENRLRERQEQMVRNAEEAKAFLEKNARREGVQVCESGLQYEVLKPGEGAVPTVDDVVTVHYRGMFTDGKEFDSSYAQGAPQLVQADGVIKGWTEALLQMKVNAKWRLYIPPELAYGRSGLEGKIPPNKILVFEIELLSIGPHDRQSLGS